MNREDALKLPANRFRVWLDRPDGSKAPIREEWDFASCPDEQLELCYQYEHLRDCPDMAAVAFEGTSAFRKIEAALGVSVLKKLNASMRHRPEVVELKRRLSLTVIQLKDHFPKPFLTMDGVLRKALLPPLELDPDMCAASHVASRHTNMTARAAELMRGGKLHDKIEFKSVGGHIGVYPIRINWSLSRDRLVVGFLEWLNCRGVESLAKANSKRTSALEHLRQLAALRLKQSGLTFREYSRFQRDNSRSGELLYDGKKSWGNSANKAKWHMTEVFHSSFGKARRPLKKQQQSEK